MPDVLGTIPQWITAISSTAVLGLIGTLVVAFWKRGVSLKGLQNADVGDIRDHYAEELERVVARQRECEHREEALRERVRKLEDEMEGLYRTMIASMADKVIEMGDAFPDHIRELAQRTRAAQKGGP